MKCLVTALSFCVAVSFLPAAKAEVSGRGNSYDSRIQTALYSPDNVFRIYAMKNRSTAIQLEPGETINLDDGILNVGKPGVQESPEWMVGANQNGSMIILKPSMYAEEPETNMIVKTNRRTYIFELKLAKSVSNMTYMFRFRYPQPPKIGETPFKGRSINQNPCSGTINRNYQKKGDMVLSPYEIWDNGTFTCMRFPTNAPRPVAYEVLPDGTETMVSSHQVSDILVLHAVSKEFRLRLNELVLGLRTKANNTGWYNYNGTTTGEIREVKNYGKQ